VAISINMLKLKIVVHENWMMKLQRQ